MKNILKIFVSFLISIVCIYFATKNIHWAELKSILKSAQFSPFFWGALVSSATFFLRAVRWQILLLPFQKIPAFTLLKWQIGGLLINNLLPLRMGELARAYWSGHKSTISKSTMMATIVIERILDVSSIFLIAVFILVITGFYKSTFSGFNSNHCTGLLILVILPAAWIIFYRKVFSRQWLKSKLDSILPLRISEMAERFLSGLEILKNAREVVTVFSLSLVIWTIDISIIMIISRSLNMHLTWMEAGLVTVGLILGVMVPAAPGAAGTYEAGGVAALTLMGIEKTLALSFILLLHTFQYIFVLIIGIPTLLMEGFNPKELIKEMKT